MLGREDANDGVPVSGIVKKAAEPAEVDAIAIGSVTAVPIPCKKPFDRP